MGNESEEGTVKSYGASKATVCRCERDVKSAIGMHGDLVSIFVQHSLRYLAGQPATAWQTVIPRGKLSHKNWDGQGRASVLLEDSSDSAMYSPFYELEMPPFPVFPLVEPGPVSSVQIRQFVLLG